MVHERQRRNGAAMTKQTSSWNEIMQYSFLAVFANDGRIDAAEMAFLEKLAAARRHRRRAGTCRVEPHLRQGRTGVGHAGRLGGDRELQRAPRDSRERLPGHHDPPVSGGAVYAVRPVPECFTPLASTSAHRESRAKRIPTARRRRAASDTARQARMAAPRACKRASSDPGRRAPARSRGSALPTPHNGPSRG